MIGPFADAQGDGAMGIFTTRAAAEEFVRGDPFVLHGVVRNWTIREWNEALVPGRPAPLAHPWLRCPGWFRCTPSVPFVSFTGYVRWVSWLFRAWRLIGGTPVHRNNRQARIHHDKGSGPPPVQIITQAHECLWYS